jgi:DinB superfamily
MSRDAAVAAFDAARDRFLTAFERVPDAALGYLPAGDDYAVGGLLAHVTWGIGHYSAVLDSIVGSSYGELSVPNDPDEERRVNEAARQGIEGGERPEALASLRAAHDGLVRRFRELPEGDFERTAKVVFGDAAEAHPTGAAVIAGWLTEHYDEHVPHVDQLLAAYERRA